MSKFKARFNENKVKPKKKVCPYCKAPHDHLNHIDYRPPFEGGYFRCNSCDFEYTRPVPPQHHEFDHQTGHINLVMD